MESTPRFTYANTHEDVKEQLDQYNQRRFEQLNSLVLSHAEGAWQFLLAVNGGGAAAMLAFIGAVSPLQKRWWPYLVLGTFVVGLVLVGIGRAYLFQRMSRLLQLWNDSMLRFYKNEIEWPQVIEDDQNAGNRGGWIATAIAWFSFASFLVGLTALCACFAIYGVPGLVS